MFIPIYTYLFLSIFIYEQQFVVCIQLKFIQMTELTVQSNIYKMLCFLWHWNIVLLLSNKLDSS